MKIDVFNHLMPRSYLARLERTPLVRRHEALPTLWDLEARLRLLDQFDDLQQVISLAGPAVETAAPQGAAELARAANDELAEVSRRHKDRFPAFLATLPMGEPEAALREMDRCAEELGATAVQIYTNVAGRPLDDPRYFPVLEHAARSDLTVFLHPTRGPKDIPDYPAEDSSRFEMWWVFGWPYETSVAMGRLVYSGIMERLPELRIVTHHLGGMVPYFEGRLAPGLDHVGARSGEPDHTLPRRPIEYFKSFYADTALCGGQAGTRCGYEFFGEDRCLFATDAPFDAEGGAMSIRDTLQAVEALDLGEAQRRKLYEGNAKRLLRL